MEMEDGVHVLESIELGKKSPDLLGVARFLVYECEVVVDDDDRSARKSGDVRIDLLPRCHGWDLERGVRVTKRIAKRVEKHLSFHGKVHDEKDQVASGCHSEE